MDDLISQSQLLIYQSRARDIKLEVRLARNQLVDAGSHGGTVYLLCEDIMIVFLPIFAIKQEGGYVRGRYRNRDRCISHLKKKCDVQQKD